MSRPHRRHSTLTPPNSLVVAAAAVGIDVVCSPSSLPPLGVVVVVVVASAVASVVVVVVIVVVIAVVVVATVVEPIVATSCIDNSSARRDTQRATAARRSSVSVCANDERSCTSVSHKAPTDARTASGTTSSIARRVALSSGDNDASIADDGERDAARDDCTQHTNVAHCFITVVDDFANEPALFVVRRHRMPAIASVVRRRRRRHCQH